MPSSPAKARDRRRYLTPGASGYAIFGKRLFDLICAAAALALTLPLLPLAALLIKRDSPGPVFFRQLRIGRYGVPFSILKFRTMTQTAASQTPAATVAGDPRITRLGRILRRYKFDELPQLINILRGEMTFVGPRPELPSYVAHYSPQERRVLDLRPGLTGAGSLAAFDEEQELRAQPDPHSYYPQVLMRRKLQFDLAYRDRISFRTDLALLLATLERILGRPPLR